MALRRFTKTVDGTIPVQALLYNDEELLASQEGVGIYDGVQKSANHQSGTVHVTTHRLFYISADHSWAHSFALDLAYVSQTDYYAGLFKSSAKITLYISPTASASTDAGTSDGPGWECQVCAYRNPPGLSPAAARVCGLCGVSRDSVPARQLSSSLPASNSMPSLLPQSTATGSHRRLPSTVACTACTFLNHPSLRECEICGTELPRLNAASPSVPLSMKSAPSSRPASPDPTDDDDGEERMIKVSFRKSGDKPFYAVLRRSLKSKAWVINSGTPASSDISAGTDANANRSGITGILRTVETTAQGRESDMTNAFRDLEALSIKARDMVRLAAELNERLTAASASAFPGSTTSPSPGSEPEEATFIRSSLSQLGLQMANAPVTLDMMKDERRWVEELARELAGVLQGKNTGREAQKGMMRERGIIALDEVWGGWNRARGVALIPPATLLQVVPQLPAYTTPPINLRIFSSGLQVLHTPPYTPAAFAARLSGLLALSGPQTILQIATEEKLSVALTGEMVGDVERDGGVCRDDEACMIKGGGGAEVRYSGNLFSGYVWDGQKIVEEDVVY